MYYNYTDEQKYFLSITDAMLKDNFSVEEIVEFWNSEDQDQVDGILGSLTLTESVDYSNPDLTVVCEKFGLGWIGKALQRLTRGIRGINPKTGNPKITKSKSPSIVKKTTEKVKTKVKQGADKVKKGVNKLPPGAKGGLAAAGAGLALIGGKDVIDYGKDAIDSLSNNSNNDSDPTTTNTTPPPPAEKPPETKGKPNTPQKTTPVAGPSGPAWWQTYEKAAPYRSSKKYYLNIRK